MIKCMAQLPEKVEEFAQFPEKVEEFSSQMVVSNLFKEEFKTKMELLKQTLEQEKTAPKHVNTSLKDMGTCMSTLSVLNYN